MAELAQAEAYAPRTLQVWRTLMNWLAFFFQIFVQIIRGTPSVAQVLSYVGLGHQALLSSSSSAPSFKPLSVVELPESEDRDVPAVAAVQISGSGLAYADDDRPLEKFTKQFLAYI